MNKPEYLGDGVYANFDGMHIVIGTREPGDSLIFLDQDVLRALVDYGVRVFSVSAATVYGNCSVCGEVITDYEVPHMDCEGEYCHAACCPVCHEGEPPYEDAGDLLERNAIADWGDR